MAPHGKKAVESRQVGWWGYAMIAANVETVTTFLREVKTGGRPFSTLAVWYALAAFVEFDTGRIVGSQRQIARAASVTLGDVQRAFKRLMAMGVLVKEEEGKYRVHPSVMWRGELTRRGQAEEKTPKLTLVDGGRTE